MEVLRVSLVEGVDDGIRVLRQPGPEPCLSSLG